MDKLKDELSDCLQNLKGSGKFASINTTSFVLPGLNVEDIGEISFPINEMQAEILKKSAKQAPFGKGSETLLDTEVRNTWEIDSDKLHFENPAWQTFLNDIIENIKEDLGIEDYSIQANLYKLLIYEEGGFFLKHKDSEKEKGMFGTLILGLPSRFSGGELVVEFEKEQVVADFSRAGLYKTGYAAFYADCDHEVKPLKSGHRICLVYNLIQEQAGKKIELASIQSYSNRIADRIKNYEANHPKENYIILLGHQYTPENFSFDHLKLNDRLKAEVLLKAADNLGYYSRLCLVTSYLTGAPEYDEYYGYDDDVDENTDIGEVYDEYLSIENWAEGNIPSLRNLSFEEKDLITSFALDEDEPIIKESSGYMGNYGPDIMHWYHYGAVCIWSPEANARMLMSENAETQMNWIDHFNRSAAVSVEEKSVVEKLIMSGFKESGYISRTLNYNPVMDWIILQKKEALLFELDEETLQHYFLKIEAGCWFNLFKVMPTGEVQKLLEKMTNTISVPVLEKLLAVLVSLSNEQPFQNMVSLYFDKLPATFDVLYGKESERIQKDALHHLIALDSALSPTNSLINEIAIAMFVNPKHKYVSTVLVPSLLSSGTSAKLVSRLLHLSEGYLQKRVDNKSQPPANWTRPVPNSIKFKRQWAVLKDFLNSPSEQVFDYRKVKLERELMEEAIRSVTIDLKMETIKIGSPHLLRITKTQGEYNRQMNIWKKDLSLLEKVRNHRAQG